MLSDQFLNFGSWPARVLVEFNKICPGETKRPDRGIYAQYLQFPHALSKLWLVLPEAKALNQDFRLDLSATREDIRNCLRMQGKATRIHGHP